MAPSDRQPTVRVESLQFAWRAAQTILDISEFTLHAGERVFLFGPSGSGKSTLLGVISGVLQPNRGQVSVLGRDLTTMTASQRDAFRSDQLGIIFQMFNLLPYLSLVENVALPCRFSRNRRDRLLKNAPSIDEEARRLLTRLGLPDAVFDRRNVTELSVGQQQRVAAARALIGAPQLIIADEPTSSLDADARGSFIDLLSEECAKSNTSLLFVSHDLSLADRFDRSVDLSAINAAPVVEDVA